MSEEKNTIQLKDPTKVEGAMQNIKVLLDNSLANGNIKNSEVAKVLIMSYETLSNSLATPKTIEANTQNEVGA